MAHPHNEPDSEFADRIDDLQEIEDSLAEHQARQQPVRKTLDECKDEVARKYCYNDWQQLLHHCINNTTCIDFYSREANELHKEASQVKPVSEWVSCSDRLPTKSGKYLIYGRFTKDTPMEVSQVYFNVKDRKFKEIGIIAKNVTHWQPLPDKPLTNPAKRL